MIIEYGIESFILLIVIDYSAVLTNSSIHSIFCPSSSFTYNALPYWHIGDNPIIDINPNLALLVIFKDDDGE